jgi:hypothetical protein
VSEQNANERIEVPLDADLELESDGEQPEERPHGPPRFLIAIGAALRLVASPFRLLARPLRWSLRRGIVIGVLVVAVLGAGGFEAFTFVWGRLHPTVFATRRVVVAVKPTPKPTPNPFLAIEATLHGPDDPDFDPTQDPSAIVPFVQRLERVNEMAGKKLVINAMYRDNSGGDRYFLAVVTSCQELNRLFPPTKLAENVEEPLRLADDFPTFAFVEYDSDGQWGVGPCGNPT